jgi:hypothetical protein
MMTCDLRAHLTGRTRRSRGIDILLKVSHGSGVDFVEWLSLAKAAAGVAEGK